MRVLAFLAVGCAPYLDVETDWNPAAVTEMGTWRTFGWLPPDGALPYASLEEDRVAGAIQRHLTRRGYVRADPGQPADFWVAWYFDVRDRVQVDSWGPYGYAGWYPGYGWDGGVWVSEWQEGVLVVDLVDPSNGKLAWRGVATSEIVDSEDPDERIGRVRRAVDAVLTRFPPRAGMD